MGGYLAKSAKMMRRAANKPVSPALGIFSPLRYAVFRRIWTASLLSNLGLLSSGGRRRLGDDDDLVIDRYGGAGPDIVDAAGRAGVDTSWRDRRYV